ncbi:MAG: spondin domain-containing protein [Betaproteobacteria bacterium]|nr:spondin domain-containing protein [Betaproteobacteria bacterium]
MISTRRLARPLATFVGVLGLAGGASAAQVMVTVTVENLTPAGSVAFAPLTLGFHGGTFDAFNIGDAATPEIMPIAEGGNGAAWLASLAATDSTSIGGAVIPSPAGPLTPGGMASGTFLVDTSVNPYFSFGTMVVPSNDFFIGNDDPMAYRLFDNGGNLLISSITQRSRDIWDAGSGIHDPAAAAFVGNGSLRADQNSVVAFNFAEFAAYNGLQTAAGYTFDSQLAANSEIYRISFDVAAVPEPQTYGLLAVGLAIVGWAGRRSVVRVN